MKSLILRHSLLSFFILTYTISWTFWILFWQIPTGYVNGFEIIAALGPALSAMVISGIRKPDKTKGKRKKRIMLFLLTSVIVMAVIVAMRLWVLTGLVEVSSRQSVDSLYPFPLAILVDLFGAAAVAFVISGVYSSRKGVRELLKTLNFKHVKTVWVWLVIAVVAYQAVILVGNALSSLLGFKVPIAPTTGVWYWVLCDAALMGLYGLFFGGGFEEPGWRGFALPALHQRFSPFVSCLILGPLWAIWHWPMFWAGDFGGVAFQVLFFSLATTQYSILFTALYKWSKYSLPVVMLFHSVINITSMYLPIAPLSNILWVLLSLLLWLWMWKKPEKFAVRYEK